MPPDERDWVAPGHGVAPVAPDMAPPAIPSTVRPVTPLVEVPEAGRGASLPRSPAMVEILALANRAEADLADGRPAEAAGWLEQALGQYPTAWRELPEGESPYQRNRRELDHPLLYARLCRTLATAYEQQDRSGDALAVRERLFSDYPDIPGSRAVCVDLARGYAARPDWEGCLARVLGVFDYTGDRCRPWRTRLRENQPYLDAISTPNDEGTVAECLGLIGQACAALHTGQPPADAELAGVASLWAQAEAAAYGERTAARWAGAPEAEGAIHTGSARADWERVVAACRDTVLEPLAHLCLAEWLHYRGFYEQARSHYGAALEMCRRLPGLSSWIEFALGELSLHTGDLHEAVGHFENCRPTRDAPLAAQASLRLAECLECLGESEQAAAASERIAAHEGWPYFVRDRATYALQRLAQYRKGPTAPAADSQSSRAAYLGQDRETQGDWRFYGRDFFALCASHGWFDVSGGALAPLPYAGGTADPGLKLYWWHGAVDLDPSMLYDPIENGRRPHNWCDRGERTPLGEGPDLVVRIPVPDGTFRLALYFVNDHNYYEPSRQYMVYVTDAATEAVLAAAPVRDFVSGVYVHFRVSGPCDLAVRVWRNTGLNTLLSGIVLDDLSAVPRWSEIRQHPLADEVVRIDPPPNYTDAQAHWARYRQAWAAGGGSALQRHALQDVAAALHDELGPYWGGRAIASVAGYMRGGGYVGQSCVLYDSAFQVMSQESPRRYGFALLEAVEAFGGGTPYYTVENTVPFKHHPHEAPLDAFYALARLRDYIALMAVPRSLVAPEDVLALARKWAKAKQRALGRLAFEGVAPDGDVQKLEPADTYAYYHCLEDADARVAILRDFLAREDRLPRSKLYLRAELVSTYLRLERLNDAEAEMERLLDDPGPDDTKYYTALHLAQAFRATRDLPRAQYWAQVILQRFPESRVAPLAKQILDHPPRAPE